MNTGGINFGNKEGMIIANGTEERKKLQSIEGTLKRIETILLRMENQSCTSDGQDLSLQKSGEKEKK